jgi:hypothetical protein
MGLFDFLKNKDSNNENSMSEEEMLLNEGDASSIVIPTHIKEAKEKKLVSKVVLENIFIVTGVYAIGTQVMLSGKVESGVLKKKMKTTVSDKESVLTDLKTHSSSVKQLIANDEGTIFLKGTNLFLVKIGDVLKFK